MESNNVSARNFREILCYGKSKCWSWIN